MLFNIKDLRNLTPHPSPPHEPPIWIIDYQRLPNFKVHGFNAQTCWGKSLPFEGRGRIFRRWLAMLRDETQFKGSMRELLRGIISPSPQATRRGGELSAGFLV